MKLRSVAGRNSQEFANHGERQGIGKVVHEIDFLAPAHFADEVVDDRVDTAGDRPHPLRGELGHDQPAQDGVIGRIAKNQGTMRVDDPVLDRIDDKVVERIAGLCMLGLRRILRTQPRVVKEAADFGMRADDIGPIVLASDGSFAHTGVERIGIGAIERVEDLGEKSFVRHDVSVILRRQ